MEDLEPAVVADLLADPGEAVVRDGQLLQQDKLPQVLQPGYLVEVEVQHPEVDQGPHILDPRDHVVGQVEAPQLPEPLQPLNLVDLVAGRGAEVYRLGVRFLVL